MKNKHFSSLSVKNAAVFGSILIVTAFLFALADGSFSQFKKTLSAGAIGAQLNGTQQMAIPGGGPTLQSTECVYVTDAEKNYVLQSDLSGNSITQWGKTGTGNGDFNFPYGIATDYLGNIYVGDQSNNRIQKFDSNHNFSFKWGNSGQFMGIKDVTVDASGNVYVVDSLRNRIQKFASDGTFILTFGWGVLTGANQFEICKAGQNCLSGAMTTGLGGFTQPSGVATDSLKNIYVVDGFNHRIEKFDQNGNYLGQWGGVGSVPVGVAVDKNDNVYVTGWGDNRVYKFDSSGGPLSYPVTVSHPQGITTDVLGNVYVTENKNQLGSNNIVYKFDQNGNSLGQWGDSRFFALYDIAIGSCGSVSSTATLTLKKNVINDNGGTAKLDGTDWTLSAFPEGCTSASGYSPISGQACNSTAITGVTGSAAVTNVAMNTNFSGSTYDLFESGGPSGYIATKYSCTINGGAPVAGNSIKLVAGDNAVCTITNDDINLICNDPNASNFGGPLPCNYCIQAFPAAIALDASTPPSQIINSGTPGFKLMTVNITAGCSDVHVKGLTFGEYHSGTQYVASNLKLIDESTSLQLGSTVATSNPSIIFSPNVIIPKLTTKKFSVVADINGPDAYKVWLKLDKWDLAVGGAITPDVSKLFPGKVMTIRQPKTTLTVTKIVNNTKGGTKTVADFPLFVNTTAVTSGVANTFTAGTYTVSETNDPTRYKATFVGACDATGKVTLNPGDNKTCTIVNTDIPADLIPLQLTFDPATTYTGTPAVSYNFTYKNIGGVAVTLPATTHMRLMAKLTNGYSVVLADRMLGTATTVPAGTAISSIGLLSTYPTTPCPLSGTTLVTVTVDSTNVVVEGSEANNNLNTTFTCTVQNPDITPPTISITYPADNATFPQGTGAGINTTAWDNAGVTKVEFRVDSNLIGTDTTAPFQAQLSTTALAKTKHTITAKAFDAAGNTATSTPITFTVY